MGRLLPGRDGGCAERDDAGDVLGATPPGTLLMAAVHEGDERSLLLHVEGADAFRGSELVPGNGEVVDGNGANVDGNFAGGLDGIAVKRHTLTAAELGDLIEWERERLSRYWPT